MGRGTIPTPQHGFEGQNGEMALPSVDTGPKGPDGRNFATWVVPLEQ